MIIAREAGAVVVDLDGTEHTTQSRATVSGAPGLVSSLTALISTADSGSR